MNNAQSPLFDAPVLVTLARLMSDGDPLVECVHRGLICVVDGLGSIVYAMGETDAPTHLRSCAKPFQVMPLINLGYFDDINPQNLADLALMMSSHSGHSIHTTRVEQLLAQNGLTKDQLRCGIHVPQDEATRKELTCTSATASELHNNCSGKHTGMLLACLKQGFALDSYESLHHPLQLQIKKALATMSDVSESSLIASVDGCSAPSWAMPLKNIALMFARIAWWQTQSKSAQPLAHASSLMWQAFTSYPEFIAGPQRFDTEVIRYHHGELISKTGADGLHAIGVRPTRAYPHGLGIVVKIADGDVRQMIRPLVIKLLLQKLGLLCDDLAFKRFVPSTTNHRKIEVITISDQLKKHS